MTAPEQIQDQKQEELLNVVEQGKMEGIVDEEEVEMKVKNINPDKNQI